VASASTSSLPQRKCDFHRGHAAAGPIDTAAGSAKKSIAKAGTSAATVACAGSSADPISMTRTLRRGRGRRRLDRTGKRLGSQGKSGHRHVQSRQRLRCCSRFRRVERRRLRHAHGERVPSRLLCSPRRLRCAFASTSTSATGSGFGPPHHPDVAAWLSCRKTSGWWRRWPYRKRHDCSQTEMHRE